MKPSDSSASWDRLSDTSLGSLYRHLYGDLAIAFSLLLLTWTLKVLMIGMGASLVVGKNLFIVVMIML